MNKKHMYRVEIPNSDAHRLFVTIAQVGEYLSGHGLTASDTIKVDGIFTVPAWAEGRKAYIALKLADCKRYGSN